MPVIKIQDAQRTIKNAMEVQGFTKTLKQLQSELESYLAKIEGAWQSDTEDKTTYTKGLRDDIAKLLSMLDVLTPFSKRLSDYAEKQLNTSNRV